jgi:hypothetical protein
LRQIAWIGKGAFVEKHNHFLVLITPPLLGEADAAPTALLPLARVPALPATANEAYRQRRALGGPRLCRPRRPRPDLAPRPSLDGPVGPYDGIGDIQIALSQITQSRAERDRKWQREE